MFAKPAPSGAATSTNTRSAPARSSPPRLGAWDYTGMLAGFLLTLAITVINSHGRLLWEDEMLGWLLLSDPSWHHMVRAWNLGADGGGFSFYLLGRAWFRLFGDSAVAFRLFSSTAFGLAFIAMWTALRRFYPIGIVAFAAANTFFCSPPFTLHMVEGRFYGLLVLGTALALWLALALDAAPDPTPKRLYLAAFLVHALLTTSHLLGVVYSVFLLLATVALDRLQDRRRFGLYATISASWLLLLPELTSIRAAARVGKPHFWTRPPTPATLLGAYTGFSSEILVALLVLAAIAVLALARSPLGIARALRQHYLSRRPVYLATAALLLVPVAFLLEGFVGTWLFNERYLLPVTLALVPVTAELLSLLPVPSRLRDGQPRFARPARLIATALFLAWLLLWDFRHVRDFTESAQDYSLALANQIAAQNPGGLPVVCEDAFTFTELIGHSYGSGARYLYLLDWPFATSPQAPRLEAMQFHLMQNWQQAGYFTNSIQDAPTFLAAHPRFLVLHAGPSDERNYPREIGNPLAGRLAQNPAYEVRELLTYDQPHRRFARNTVWLVCRGSCDTNP